MKSQDVFLLLKLVSLQKQEKYVLSGVSQAWPVDWQDWDDEFEVIDSCNELFLEKYHDENDYIVSLYTARALERVSGISKSQVNLALNRCLNVGLIRYDRKISVPRTNKKALFDFIVCGLKYVFPAKPAELTRGIATAFAAPVLNQKLMSAGDLIPVWSDARGNTKGQAIEPLFKSVVYAVRTDPELYALLALVDAIRIGQPREANLAADLLKQHLELN